MRGHAGCAGPDGIDRVCAAVSALNCSLINALTDLSGDQIWSETCTCMAVLE